MRLGGKIGSRVGLLLLFLMVLPTAFNRLQALLAPLMSWLIGLLLVIGVVMLARFFFLRWWRGVQ